MNRDTCGACGESTAFCDCPRSPWIPASTPPTEDDGEVLVRMEDGTCEIAWPTYWHGASNAFAQWTFRDPDRGDDTPKEWMRIPN